MLNQVSKMRGDGYIVTTDDRLPDYSCVFKAGSKGSVSQSSIAIQFPSHEKTITHHSSCPSAFVFD